MHTCLYVYIRTHSTLVNLSVKKQVVVSMIMKLTGGSKGFVITDIVCTPLIVLYTYIHGGVRIYTV